MKDGPLPDIEATSNWASTADLLTFLRHLKVSSLTYAKALVKFKTIELAIVASVTTCSDCLSAPLVEEGKTGDGESSKDGAEDKKKTATAMMTTPLAFNIGPSTSSVDVDVPSYPLEPAPANSSKVDNVEK